MTIRPLHTPAVQPTLKDSGESGKAWLDASLGRLIEHVRKLVDVDGVAFLTVDADRRQIEPLADWFASPVLRDASEAANHRPYDRRRPGIVEYVLERDRPLLLPRLEAWESAPDMMAAAEEAMGDARAGLVWETYRAASLIAVPVKTAIGRALGVLVVGCLPPKRPYGPAELRTVQVLADLSGLALERAELLEQEGRRARGEVRLKRASEAMSSSLELEHVYRSIVRYAATVSGSSRALLTRLNPRAGELRPVASVDLSEELAGRRFQLDTGVLGEVARSRRACIRDAGRDETWGVAAGSSMHAPIELGPRLYGVLSVAHEEEGRFAEEDLELLVKLSRSSAAAIANAIDFQRERRIARALTLGFVPESLPEVDGHDTGLLYMPAASEPAGGDVYGAWGLRDGSVAVLVGDVAGKGVETAALSAMVRFFIEARSWDSPDPCKVLAQANSLLTSRLPADSFATVFLGVLSPGRLRYCNAGHLPPLHVTRDGVRKLGGHGLPLGIEQNPNYEEQQLELEPGELVFAYTDGLLEARRGGELFGEERLARLVEERAGELHPRELVRSVHDEVASWAGGITDDAVALALRRRA
jgi:serine phosphatase RsbU (regulator of sigma subunit)